jgi:hypothetical protein
MSGVKDRPVIDTGPPARPSSEADEEAPKVPRRPAAGIPEAQDGLDGGGLNPRQAAAVAALLGGASAEEAARRAGVGRSTLFRWKADDPAFREALDAGRRALVEKVRDGLVAGLGEGVQVLREAAREGDARAAARLAEIGARVALGAGGGVNLHVQATATVAGLDALENLDGAEIERRLGEDGVRRLLSIAARLQPKLDEKAVEAMLRTAFNVELDELVKAPIGEIRERLGWGEALLLEIADKLRGALATPSSLTAVADH